MSMSKLAALAIVVALTGVADKANSQTAEDFRAQIDAAIQKHKAAAAGMGQTRGLVFNNNQDIRQDLYPTPSAPAQTVAPTSAFNIRVGFGFASARMTNPSDPRLVQMAHAMAVEEYQPYLFMVVGHTDAKGSDAYNMSLSRKRANSVVAFLASKGVPEARLVPVGRGKTQLLDPSHPESDVNRRVEVLVMQQAEK